MQKHMKTLKASIVVIAGLSLFATACTMNPNNQTRQQNVQNDNRGAQMLGDQNDGNGLMDERKGATDDRNGLADNQAGTADDRIEIADRAATNIVKIKGVHTANVLVTRRNAYVAAALDGNQSKMKGDIEKKIANQVRKTDPRIQNVYVSTNPQFVDRVNGYVRDVQQGRPVTGFVQEFNEMVARIFPTAK